MKTMICRKYLFVTSPVVLAATLVATMPAMAEETQPAAGAAVATTPGEAAAGVRIAAAETDTITVPRSEWEQMKRDIEALKGAQGTGVGAAALAEPGNAKGWYLGLGASHLSRAQSTDISAVPQTAAVFKDGMGVNGSLGYRFKNGIRLEAETSYQNNKNQTFITDTATGANEPSVGNVALRAFMANVYYDIPLKNKRWKPFIGGGYGTYQSSINGFTAPSLSAGNIVLDTRSFETKAWQYRVGVGYALNRRTEFSLGYRKFLGTLLKFRFDVPPVPGLVVPLDVTGGNTESIEAGIRVFF